MQALDCLENFVLKSNIAEGAAAPYKGSWWRKLSVSEGRQSFTSSTCSPSNTGFWHVFNLFKRTAADGASDSEQGCALAATMPQIVQHGFESKKLDGLVKCYWSKIIQISLTVATESCFQRTAHNLTSWDASKAGRGRGDVRSTGAAAGLRIVFFWSILMRW